MHERGHAGAGHRAVHGFDLCHKYILYLYLYLYFMALSFEPSAGTANPSGAPASVGAAYVSPAVSGVTVGGDAGTLSCADVSTLTIAGANFGPTTVDNAANKVLQLQLGDGAVGNWPFTMAAAAADGACAVTVADTENLIQCSGILPGVGTALSVQLSQGISSSCASLFSAPFQPPNSGLAYPPPTITGFTVTPGGSFRPASSAPSRSRAPASAPGLAAA